MIHLVRLTYADDHTEDLEPMTPFDPNTSFLGVIRQILHSNCYEHDAKVATIDLVAIDDRLENRRGRNLMIRYEFRLFRVTGEQYARYCANPTDYDEIAEYDKICDPIQKN